ncbi:MAG: hypothetical protein A3J85_03210 [Desulfobacula sp. RIFOXYA12_FULL_46_16]|nr:MAG: hypothetical protein A3J85_03210 [Desulfobacula sp. RIFOXYA12_FULL_46_16]
MPFPFMGAALAAIAPELAKRGLDLLSGIFRGEDNQDADQVSEWIKEKTGIEVNDIAEGKITEDQWVKLKAFELEHQEQLIEYRKSMDAHALELEKLRMEDTKNSREAQSGRDKDEGLFIRWFTYIYAFLITGLTFVFIFMAAFFPALFDKDLPEQSWRIIDTVLGFLLGVGLSAIIQFYFGSSNGSAKKSEDISRMLKDQSWPHPFKNGGN